MQEFPYLDKLICAGTDEKIIKLYHSLPKLAQELEVKLFDDEYVVADCETTGFDPNQEALIEISACILSGNKITEDFDTFVDPKKEIPRAIVELTGITQEDVKGAPSTAEAVAQFAKFAGGRPVIAHNANFDYSFIVPKAEEGAINHDWLDSLALSNIVLPRLKSHKLQDLSRAFNLHASTHRACDDVEALAQLWPILLAGVHSMPRGLANYIAQISTKTRWPLRSVFQEVAALDVDAHFSLNKHRIACVNAAKTRIYNNSNGNNSTNSSDNNNASDPSNANSSAMNNNNNNNTNSEKQADKRPKTEPVFPSSKDIDEAFSKEGLAGKMYPYFEPRASQTKMAHEVTKAFKNKEFCVLEANTGVGKSMAYLLPAALSAKKNNMCFGIATKTNALTDQLMFHELPDLARAIKGLSYIALKGYDHYVCLRKLERAAKNNEIKSNEIEYIAAILGLCVQSIWTDLDSLHISSYNQPRDEIVASPHKCLKRYCPHYLNGCYLHGARRFAQKADIVVTNHALLFCNMEADNSILPPIKNWIIDEAHTIENDARKQLSLQISAKELSRALHKITDVNSGLIKQINRKAAELSGTTLLFTTLSEIESLVSDIEETSESFFLLVKDLLSLEEHDSAYKTQTIWISPDVRNTLLWHHLYETGDSLSKLLEALIKRMRGLVTVLETYEDKLKEQSADAGQITCSLADMCRALKLVLSGEDKEYVYSADVHADKERLVETLTAEKFDIGATLAQELYPEFNSMVFTSATLSTGDVKKPFEHFLQASGLSHIKKERVKCMTLPSNYNFNEHMHIILPAQMPEANKTGEFEPALIELLYGIHAALGGSVLTLFTSKRAMQSCYYELKDKLKNAGLDLIMQTSGNKNSIQERFIEEKALSLFALKSFWEGFDAPGDTLRCVVIVRLPFTTPKDPLICERNVREENSWWRFSLPESITEVKQAAGRLIRCSTDEGFLVLADGRLRTKKYGADYLRALPSNDIKTLTNEEIFDLMKRSRK